MFVRRRLELEVVWGVAIELHARSKNIVVVSSVKEIDVIEADGVVVQMTETVLESEGNKSNEEKNEMISVANEIADIKGHVIKNQSSIYFALCTLLFKQVTFVTPHFHQILDNALLIARFSIRISSLILRREMQVFQVHWLMFVWATCIVLVFFSINVTDW